MKKLNDVIVNHLSKYKAYTKYYKRNKNRTPNLRDPYQLLF